MSHTVLQPPDWPRPLGYANGIAAVGRSVYTAGLVGWDAQGRFAPGLTAQCAQTFANILAVLAEADARAEHIVRLTWYITDRTAYLAQAPSIGAAYRAAFGKHYPAMAVVQVAALMEPQALVEIEATAVIPA